MAIITDITKLSQTASLNGPDGSVDPPSSLDDQDRYLGSFIAMLRDGIGFTGAASITTPLGFTPVRQGGNSSGTTANVVSVGYNPTLGKLVCAVDTNQFSNQWPIDANYALAIRNTGVAAGAPMTFSWRDPGAIPGYLWGGDGPGDMYLTPPGRLSVNYAASSGSCSGNAATASTASNANAVNGLSGWTYTNSGANPAYIWCTDGAGTYQHLTTPAALSVGYATNAGNANYAGSAGSAPANGGTAENSNNLGGFNQTQFVHNNNNVVWLQSNGVGQMQANVGGTVVFWGTSVSDARLKKNIVPTEADSLEQIGRMRFVGHDWRQDLDVELPKEFSPVAILAQEAELIEPRWIVSSGTWKQPDLYPMLMSAMHSIQQLGAKVAKLERLITGGS